MNLQQAKEILNRYSGADSDLSLAINIVLEKLSPNGTKILEGVHTRYKELEENYEFDWRSFYNGWIESRTEFCYGDYKQGELRQQQKQK